MKKAKLATVNEKTGYLMLMREAKRVTTERHTLVSPKLKLYDFTYVPSKK